MTEKAVITLEDVDRDQAQLFEREQADELGIFVEMTLPYGTLVVADAAQRAQFEARGLWVTPLLETNILGIGTHRIDITDLTPAVANEFRVPDDQRSDWRLHLVQLKAPPSEAWIRDIEQAHVDVIETISRYGLVVVGSAATVAGLRERFSFVAWTGLFEPGYGISDELLALKGLIRYVSVAVYPTADIQTVDAALPSLNAGKLRDAPPPKTGRRDEHPTLLVEIDRDQLFELALTPGVRSLEYAAPESRLAGERDVQIVAGNLVYKRPFPGYRAWLETVGLSGEGVCVAICDSGVDTNDETGADIHVDFGGGRLKKFVPFDGNPGTDEKGHGTVVASIAVGNAASDEHEQDDPGNFLWGLGVAPAAHFVAMNAVNSDIWPPEPPVLTELTSAAVANRAQVMNNSWEVGGSTGYTELARQFDRLARDPDESGDNRKFLVIVAAAGNGGPNAGSIWPPHEAKNIITVGATYSDRYAGTAGRLWHGSSRGPAQDGRLLPTVVAPGADVSGARSSSSGLTRIDDTGTVIGHRAFNAYAYDLPGTSYAAPHVAGGCALIIEWWRQRHSGDDPSPAMVKALLVNGADDLCGELVGYTGKQTNVPNCNQGWGRVNLTNIFLDHPESERGPKISIDNAAPFTATGQKRTIRVAAVDEARPMRITLVWMDAPAAAGSNPARVNNLDLKVSERATGAVFKGNNFEGGFSIAGGEFKDLDNVECVYIAKPSGTYDVIVKAASLSGNALPPFDFTAWQDFALVIDNAEPVP